MKTKKLIALGLLTLMLAGCGMPKVDYDGVESPLFVKDESGAAASGNETVTGSEGTEGNAAYDSTAPGSSVTDSLNRDSEKADSTASNKKAGTGKKESPADSVPTESSLASGSIKNDTASQNTPIQLSAWRVSISDYEYDSKERLGLMTEVHKMIYNDRGKYMGDPEFVEVPIKGILSKERAAELAKLITPGEEMPTKLTEQDILSLFDGK